MLEQSKLPANVERERKYWAFLAHPKFYDIEAAIRALETDDWLTADKPINQGDWAIVWKAKGSDDNRGIVALAEIITDPMNAEDRANPFWRVPTELAGLHQRVRVRYVTPQNLPLWLNQPGNEFLADLAVAKAHGGTVFYLSTAEWGKILQHAGQWEACDAGEATLEQIVRPSRLDSGQGLALDAGCRRAVELRAMELAKQFYISEWLTVYDVSSNASYDLHCVSGDHERRVEVKGTTGRAKTILLTANEVMIARQFHPNTALFVVEEIVLDRTATPPTATGGKGFEIQPWAPDDSGLAPVAYRYRLPRA